MDDSIQIVLDQESPKVRQELAKVMEKQNAWMQSAAQEFAHLHAKVRKAQEEFHRVVAASLETVQVIDVDGLAKRAVSDAIILADCGWTTPDWLTLREHHELARMNAQELDEAFQEMYLSDSRSKLDFVRSNLESDSSTEKWRNLIHQLFDCLDRNEHVIAIPALFVLLEALVAEYLAKGDKELILKTNPAKIFRGARAQAVSVGTVRPMIAASAGRFLDCLYAPSRFDGQPPSLINRHWVMHGRDASNWSLADALRLLNAVGTLHWLLSDTRPSTLV
jgi:hypothetical protein